MAYIPPEIFCKIPVCLHKKIEHYLSHPVADLVKALFKDWKAIFVENTNRDYILSAKWRASELKVYKNIQEKLYRQMKLDMKFGTNSSKIYRDQLAEKRFENIVTKTMLDIRGSYHPLTRGFHGRRKVRWETDLPRSYVLSDIAGNMMRGARVSKPTGEGIRPRIPYGAVSSGRWLLPGYACFIYAKKEVLFAFVQGLNPKARKSWKKEKLMKSIYPNLRF